MTSGEIYVVSAMAYFRLGNSPINYFPCQYSGSKLMFRGPRRELNGDYTAFLGASETYGKFIAKPFPALIEAQTGVKCVNFGWPNAGVDAFLNDPGLLQAATGARICVLQLPCAQNLSNRYYRVHPRRNDRFIEASKQLRLLYDEVDFTDFHFTRHLLGHLKHVSPERFEKIGTELQAIWMSRMQTLIERINSEVILLWVSSRSPDEGCNGVNVSEDPLFVTREMIEGLRPMVTRLVEITVSDAALSKGTKGMVFSSLESLAAASMLGPAAHREVADMLSPIISDFARQIKRPA